MKALLVLLLLGACGRHKSHPAETDKHGDDTTRDSTVDSTLDSGDDTNPETSTGDDTSSCTEQIWYPDADGDGHGATEGAVTSCVNPGGYLLDSSDCDDSDAGVYPGATELCGDGKDDDCDGTPGTCLPWGTAELSDADIVLLGTSSGEEAGFAVAGGADLNGDGKDDLLVGSRLASVSAPYAGAVALVMDPPSGRSSLGESGLVIAGIADSDEAGSAVAMGGDLNGDGIPDVLVGAPATASSVSSGGSVALLLGPPVAMADLSGADLLLLGEHVGDAAGREVTATGDTDGDALPDLAVSADYNDDAGENAGAVYIVTTLASGASGALADAGTRYEGVAPGDRFGDGLTAMGDLDGDGLAELAVGAPYASVDKDQQGVISVFRGGAMGVVSSADADATWSGEEAGDNAGGAISAIGDLDGDGTNELCIGAPKSAGTIGAAYLIFDPLGGGGSIAAADVLLRGATATDGSSGDPYGDYYAGASVASAGDVDADGYRDLLIGAWDHTDVPSHDAGAAYLLYGPVPAGSYGLMDDVGTTLGGVRLLGEAQRDAAGWSVAGAGDVDGDGADDVIVGAYDWGATDDGAAYVVLGGFW